MYAFHTCDQLTDVEMPEVERIGDGAFSYCTLLRRIAIPLKNGIFDGDDVFNGCENLSWNSWEPVRTKNEQSKFCLSLKSAELRSYQEQHI